MGKAKAKLTTLHPIKKQTTMSNPKPIVVIYWPDNFVAGGNDRNWIYEFMAFLNGEETNASFYKRHDFSDYHWFCFYQDDIREPQLQVFYEKDFTPIQYEELKKMVMDSLPKPSQQTENQ